MTCLHSSDGMGDTWTRKPLLTVRWLLISPESRRGMSNIIIIKALTFKQFKLIYEFVFLLIVTCAISNGCSFLLSYAFSAEGVMRTMTTEKLLKGMPVLQTQIDTLLEFDVSQMLTRLLHLLDRTMQHHKTRGSSSLSPRRFIPRSWTTGSSMPHLCFSSRTWSNCLHPTMTESSTY